MRLAVGRAAPSGAGFVLECGQDTLWPKPQTVQHKTLTNARRNVARDRDTILQVHSWNHPAACLFCIVSNARHEPLPKAGSERALHFIDKKEFSGIVIVNDFQWREVDPRRDAGERPQASAASWRHMQHARRSTLAQSTPLFIGLDVHQESLAVASVA
jgi:hypothetical protein